MVNDTCTPFWVHLPNSYVRRQVNSTSAPYDAVDLESEVRKAMVQSFRILISRYPVVEPP